MLEIPVNNKRRMTEQKKTYKKNEQLFDARDFISQFAFSVFFINFFFASLSKKWRRKKEEKKRCLR